MTRPDMGGKGGDRATGKNHRAVVGVFVRHRLSHAVGTDAAVSRD